MVKDNNVRIPIGICCLVTAFILIVVFILIN